MVLQGRPVRPNPLVRLGLRGGGPCFEALPLNYAILVLQIMNASQPTWKQCKQANQSKRERERETLRGGGICTPSTPEEEEDRERERERQRQRQRVRVRRGKSRSSGEA